MNYFAHITSQPHTLENVSIVHWLQTNPYAVVLLGLTLVLLALVVARPQTKKLVTERQKSTK